MRFTGSPPHAVICHRHCIIFQGGRQEKRSSAMRVRHCPFKKRYRRNRRPTAPQRPGTRKDLTGSDLWPDGACCTVMMAIRSSRRRALFLRLADSPKTANAELPYRRPAAPGYTERPARVQFMLGRVGLYSDVTYSHNRPDSKRPQALKSRVACAKRSECKLSLPVCGP